MNNPTQASSEAPGHSARLGNDGNPVTFWQAQDAVGNAWWQVDLERVIAVSQTRLDFPSEGNYRYRIEFSHDQVRWTLGVDQTRNLTTDKSRTDTVVPAVGGRFVRVTFTGSPAGSPPRWPKWKSLDKWRRSDGAQTARARQRITHPLPAVSSSASACRLARSRLTVAVASRRLPFQ